MRGDLSRLHAEHPHHMPFVKFDFTHPGFQAYTLAMWKGLAKDGLQGIKFDYPESAWIPTGGFRDETHTTTSAYRKVFKICREGLGDGAFIHERNLGEYGTPMLDVTAGIVDLQRVWFDSSHFEPEMASRMGLRWYKNRSVFGYYPDGKSFKGMDTDARRTMLTLVGLLSGRLELGTSFGRMTAEEQYDLTRLYPLLKGTRSFRPVDMLAAAPADPSVYVYANDADAAQLILTNNHDEAPHHHRAPSPVIRPKPDRSGSMPPPVIISTISGTTNSSAKSPAPGRVSPPAQAAAIARLFAAPEIEPPAGSLHQPPHHAGLARSNAMERRRTNTHRRHSRGCRGATHTDHRHQWPCSGGKHCFVR